MYGVDSKEEPSYKCWPDLREDDSTQLNIEITHHSMQEHIDKMVAHGSQPMHQVVQLEGGHTQGTVRLVAVFITDRDPPEVIGEEIIPGAIWSEVLILLYSCRIIKAEATVQRVEVDTTACQDTEQGSTPAQSCHHH